MILQALAALILLAQAAPAPTPDVAPPAPAPVAVAPQVTDPVILEIDRLMGAWKGKSGENLRGRLGLTTSTRPATDGEVVFWTSRAASMGCVADPAMGLRCGSAGEAVCQLGVAFSKDGKVINWRASGSSEACRKFAAAIGEP